MRRLDFWLPALTLGLTALVWVLVTSPESRAENRRENLDRRRGLMCVPFGVGSGALAGSAGFLVLPGWRLPRAPQIAQAVIGSGAAGPAGLGSLPRRFAPASRLLRPAALALLLVLFAVLKVPALALAASAGLRAAAGQSAELAAAADLRWLGYSYVAFRLIHVLPRPPGRARNSR